MGPERLSWPGEPSRLGAQHLDGLRGMAGPLTMGRGAVITTESLSHRGAPVIILSVWKFGAAQPEKPANTARVLA